MNTKLSKLVIQTVFVESASSVGILDVPIGCARIEGAARKVVPPEPAEQACSERRSLGRWLKRKSSPPAQPVSATRETAPSESGRLVQLFVAAAILALMAASPAWAQTISSYYTLSSGSASLTNLSITTSTANQSAVYVLGGAKLNLVTPTLTTTGNTTNSDYSSFYGLNAVVLASTNSSVNIAGGTVIGGGTGANGVFAVGTNATIGLSGVTIYCTNQYGHGVDATFGGVLNLTNVTASTKGGNGSVIATDRGGGTIFVKGGKFTAAGQDSAGLYSTGKITVLDATLGSTGGEAVVVEGANSAILTNTTISGVKGAKDRGVFIYQSMSGDSTGYDGVFTMVGGAYTWPSSTGPAFYLSNTKGDIYLKGVAITNSSPILLQCTTNQWGTAGANGATANLIADSQTLAGAVLCDKYSSNTVVLQNGSTLTGCINPAALSVDATSAWIATSNSALRMLTNAGAISGTVIVTNYSTIRLQGGSISVSLAGTNGLVKTTTNTAILTGANTYTGTTLVSNGTLVVGTAFAGKGNFWVTNAASLGFTNIQSGASAAISNLNLAAGTTLQFLNVADSSAPLLSASNLVLAGACTVQVLGTNGLAAGLAYPLVSYAGNFSGSFANLQLQLPAGFSGTLVSNAHQVILSLTGAPSVPTNLCAVAGNGQVTLAWNAAASATGYNVRGSTTNGGPYACLVSLVAATNCACAGLSNGVLYYFVVTATNTSTALESACSSQAAARPIAASSPSLTFSCGSGQLSVAWPADHTGWLLEAQTNQPGGGLGTNWVLVDGTEGTNAVAIPIASTNGSVFFRLAHP
jgi:autotransporter-associated beta strand protein